MNIIYLGNSIVLVEIVIFVDSRNSIYLGILNFKSSLLIEVNVLTVPYGFDQSWQFTQQFSSFISDEMRIKTRQFSTNTLTDFLIISLSD